MTHYDDITRRAIPTQYRGYQLKSRFEANVARLIDALNFEWLYEPQSFLLETSPTTTVHYQPDFYVPSLRLWIEARGYRTQKGDSQIDAFSALICNGGIDEDMRMRDPWNSEDAGHGSEMLPPPYATMTAPDYLVLSDAISFSEWFARFGIGYSPDATIATCADCHGAFFLGGGSFQCRICGAHDGDHHLSTMQPVSVRGSDVYAGGVIAAEWVLRN